MVSTQNVEINNYVILTLSMSSYYSNTEVQKSTQSNQADVNKSTKCDKWIVKDWYQESDKFCYLNKRQTSFVRFWLHQDGYICSKYRLDKMVQCGARLKIFKCVNQSLKTDIYTLMKRVAKDYYVKHYS